MYVIPDPEGCTEDAEFAYQGIPLKGLDRAIMLGWVPVKKGDKTGRNWMEGPNGYRMWGEQVLCKIPIARKEAMDQEINDYRKLLTVEKVQERFEEEVLLEGGGFVTPTGDIHDSGGY